MHKQNIITLCPIPYALLVQEALEQQDISLSVATELFKAARLQRAEDVKDATLANVLTTETEDKHMFTVEGLTEGAEDFVRERYLGLKNRVVAGMLLHTSRTRAINCADSQFHSNGSVCSAGVIIYTTDTCSFCCCHRLARHSTCASFAKFKQCCMLHAISKALCDAYVALAAALLVSQKRCMPLCMCNLDALRFFACS